MRVAMLTTVGTHCGIAAYTRDLVQALRELVDVEVEPIQVGRQPVEHYREQAARLNEADAIHIQHEHSFWGGILPGHSAFWEMRYLLRKPVVITAHTTYSLAQMLRVREERRPIHALAKRMLLLRRGYRDSVETAPFVTGRCIVHTEEGRRVLTGRGADPDFLHLIPAGVPEPAPAGGGALRERFALGEKRLITLFGYIAPNKGYEITFQVLAELPPDVHLVVAGGPRTPADEEYAARVRQMADSGVLNGRVTITGFLSDADIADAMAASEVVLAPHTQATGSYSVMIPLSYGNAVLASDLAIFREVRERGDCLRLFRNGDAGDYLRQLRNLLDDAALRADLAERARTYAAQHSWREIARRTVEVYSAALSDATRRVSHA